MPVLTGIDVLGVQRYVFASSRLQDAVAASWLVHWATASDGALGGDAGGEVLLASGGNAILRFGDIEQARGSVARYTRRLHDEAPSLEVAVAHRSYGAGGLADAIEKLQVDLARAKLKRLPSVPQLGLSVTASCRITGLPAVGFDPQDRSIPLSRMVLRWRDEDVRSRAQDRWEAFLKGTDRFAFPAKIDNMGRTRGDTSLLGVVHIDGNGIGERIADWLCTCRERSRPDDDVRDQMREWSAALDQAGHDSLAAVGISVTRSVVTKRINDKDRPFLAGRVSDLDFELSPSGDGRTFLPLRPVLLGGDDLTFLCDGRIALDLAETALGAFAADIPHLGRGTACAGVALVPAHTPFERAYELAETLCSNAKRRRREKNDSESWIDWHIGAPRPGEGIGDLRRRAYTEAGGSTSIDLTCRPYRLGANAAEVETWRWLSQTVLGTGPDGFRGERWRQHRNKIKELASLVREGADGIERARGAWTAAGGLALPGSLGTTNGFLDGTRTPLLDAIELLDIHLPLAEGTSS